ncbi:hypothetical protein [Portibacter marinus]|uniref:hypothetical protein n=1 Tax=Portibacter marinus TaxID=2898660 RepID=UPI001F1E5BFC|nr:hypothetical protein [Portibacter marinus]
MSKPRVVKDYDKLDQDIQEQIKLTYPHGFDKHLITFKNIKNAFVSALPYETEEKYYLVRMTREEAIAIIADDDDYKEGKLRKAVMEELSIKHDFDDDDDDDEDDDDLIDDEILEFNEDEMSGEEDDD